MLTSTTKSDDGVVSLFTREWIEIDVQRRPVYLLTVSLFTREWIEIAMTTENFLNQKCLPLYEGVD